MRKEESIARARTKLVARSKGKPSSPQSSTTSRRSSPQSRADQGRPMTAYQLYYLLPAFLRDQCPTLSSRQGYARLVNESERRIKNWFNNRRQKWAKVLKECGEEAVRRAQAQELEDIGLCSGSSVIEDTSSPLSADALSPHLSNQRSLSSSSVTTESTQSDPDLDVIKRIRKVTPPSLEEAELLLYFASS
ncbi:hypothetical protein EW146_g5963 [Bondarzewia mesenterica]|uniref:Homeobox domain-containing protein n=1 Tax=Bondarzewia mesenterica TaxID=1095465 RepID=A0A4V6S1E7_9AGAM|nr:hypothetical protein EW146_g5963 [Bondarzewia mesenterica]